MSRLLLLSASAWLLAAAVHAQSPSSPRYKVLSVDTVTGENLTRVASEGYRIAERGGRVAASFMVFERSTGAYEYMVSDALPEDLTKVPPGYRILPHTVVPGRRGLCAAILERAPGDRVIRDYRIERGGYVGKLGILIVPKSLRKGIAKAATDGYRVIAVGGNCAVLERPPDATREAAGTPPRYQLIAPRSTKALEREMPRAVARGYRLHGIFHDEGLVFVLERQDKAPAPDHLVVAAEWPPNQSWVPRLAPKLNEAASRGYHLLEASMATLGNEVVAVMEKREAPVVEYRVLEAFNERGFTAPPSWRALEQEFVAASEQGWEYVALANYSDPLQPVRWEPGYLDFLSLPFPPTVRAIVLQRPAGPR
jgi:hypothetical protein